MSKIDIFKWREAEFQKKFEENGYNWLDVKSRLEKISESEKIDKKLEDLQWRVEDYYEYLVSLYEKAKKEEIEENQVSNDKQEEKTELSTDELVDKYKKVIEENETYKNVSKMPVIWWIVSSLVDSAVDTYKEQTEVNENDNFFDKMIKNVKKWFAWLILGFFWVQKFDDFAKDGKNLVEKWKDLAVNLSEKGKDALKNAKETAKEKAEELWEFIQPNYTIWFTLLRTFSKEKFEDQDPKNLISKFYDKEGKSYNDLAEEFKKMRDLNWNMKLDEVRKFKENNPGLKENNYSESDIFNSLKMIYNSESTRIILKELTPDNIKKVLEKQGEEKFKWIFWEESFENLKKNNFDFRVLSLKNVIVLLGLTYNWMAWISLLNWFEDTKEFVWDFLFWESKILEDVKKLQWELQERKENLLPIKVFDFLKWDWGVNMWWESELNSLVENYNYKNKEKYKNLSDIEKEKTDKFFDFTKKVLEEFRNPNSKYSLWLPEFTNNFNKVINLRQISYLYIVFDWKTGFLTWNNSFQKSLVYGWIYKMFENGKDTLDFSAQYASVLAQESLNEKEDYFTKDEKVLIWVVRDKLIKKAWNEYIDIYKKGHWLLKSALPNSIPENEKNYIAYVIEAFAWYAVGKIAFSRIPPIFKFIFTKKIILATAAIFAVSYNDSLVQKMFNKDTFEQVKDYFNKFLWQEKLVMKENINWKEEEIVISSTDDYLKYNKDPQKFLEEQKSREKTYSINSWEKSAEIVWDKLWEWIYVKTTSTWPVFVKDLKEYEIWFKYIVDIVENYNPLFSIKNVNWAPINFWNYELKDDWVIFPQENGWVLKIEFQEITQALRGKPKNDFGPKFYPLKNNDWNGNLVLKEKKNS